MADEARPVDSQFGKTPRASQRASTSCSTCYRRKVKCSKAPFPCQACIRLGQADTCSRETVIVRGKLVTGDQDPRRTLSAAELLVENVALRKKLERSLDPESSTTGSSHSQSPPATTTATLPPATAPPSRHPAIQHQRRSSHQPVSPIPPSLPVLNPESVANYPPPWSVKMEDTTEDALRRASRGDQELFRTDLVAVGLTRNASDEDNSPEREVIRPPSVEVDGEDLPPIEQPAWKEIKLSADHQIRMSLLSLVPIERSHILVTASLHYLSWNHCVVHVPSYLVEHDAWIRRLATGDCDVDDGWLALYFALISSGLFYLDPAMGVAAGFSEEEINTLPRTWFDASVQALQMTDFLASWSTHSTLAVLQTICVLPLIAHCFNSSTLAINLLHSGFKLAQTMGFHLLGPEECDIASVGRTRRELGRRIWQNLIRGEGMGPTAYQPGALYFNFGQTSPPLNIDDEDLSDDHPVVPLPLSDPTVVTGLLVKGRMGILLRSFNEAFYCASTVEARYAVSRETDLKIAHFLDDFPQLRKKSDMSAPVDLRRVYDHLPWSRYEWSVNLSWMRIIIWRPFLSKEYGSPFESARTICLESSRKILAERAKRLPHAFEKFWYISSKALLAGVVILRHLQRLPPDDTLRTELSSEVRHLIATFDRQGTTPIISKGKKLLSRMLETEEQRIAASQAPTFDWPPGTLDGNWDWLWPALGDMDMPGVEGELPGVIEG
ncbi:hypothetical protein T439DRAFT_325944 [Meredithblackwellia eburnea MCA 4105]